jgi:hypothetical protein
VDRVTGYVRHRAEELVDALKQLDAIDPHACRRHVEENFAPEKMVTGYEQVYRGCLSGAGGR